ncbi:extracellular solute-binding protein [Granulosicoccus sp. 3-233]|uniref:extracellular solute-binding protein n=1 Tax=Granulosicoccus sp. 3-233 TaxID=3417969 RepID=UPI003D324C5F
MTENRQTHLRGMTWNHARGIEPLLAASRHYEQQNPGVRLSWDSRPLQDFESQPLREICSTHDLIIIDHPHLGEAVRENLLLDLTTCRRSQALQTLQQQSAGPSHDSYGMHGGQWALAMDAATPVASYRADQLEELPATWEDVMLLASAGKVIMPLRPPHGLMALLWLASNRGACIADNPEQLMADDDIASALEQLYELTSLMRSSCFDMDPIDVYEILSTRDKGPIYCPHAYGYINYTLQNFRPYPLTFTDVPDAAGGGVRGTVLGGSGIAVSASSSDAETAVDFAFHVAGAECQTSSWVRHGGQPGNALAWSDAETNRLSNNFMNNTRATLDAAWVRPRYSGYTTFQNLASHTISDFLQGRLSRPHCVQALQKLYRESHNQ